MRKLTEEEVAQLPAGGGGRRSTYLRRMLLTLKPGEGITMLKSEWKGKGRVHDVANRIKRKLGWEFEITESADKSSWNFKRVK